MPLTAAVPGEKKNEKHTRYACVPAGHLQESRGPPGRKPRKSLKKVFLGLPAQSLKKVPKRSKKSPKSLQKVSFRGLFDLFGTFLRLWAGRPRKTFLRLFRDFRRGGPRDSCRWPAGTLAAQKSHRKIAVTTVAASGLATISLQKSQGFSPCRPQKKSLAASDFWGLASKSQENRSDHGRKSPQPRDFAAAATTGH